MSELRKTKKALLLVTLAKITQGVHFELSHTKQLSSLGAATDCSLRKWPRRKWYKQNEEEPLSLIATYQLQGMAAAGCHSH